MERLLVIDVLDYLGVSPKYNGYKYIVDETVMMLDLVNKNERIILSDLFEEVAKIYHTRSECVEKNTRTCVEGTFKNGNLDHIDRVFENIAYYYDDRPSNKLFLTAIVNYLNKNRMMV